MSSDQRKVMNNLSAFPKFKRQELNLCFRKFWSTGTKSLYLTIIPLSNITRSNVWHGHTYRISMWGLLIVGAAVPHNKMLNVLCHLVGRIILFVGAERAGGAEGLFAVFGEVAEGEFFACFFVLLRQGVDGFGTG